MSDVGSERRADEKRRRELAEQNRGQVDEGSGQPIEGRALPQVVSLRLDPESLRRLRELAKEREVTVSDLLRKGAEMILSVSTSGYASYWISAARGVELSPMIKTAQGGLESPTRRVDLWALAAGE